MTTERYTIELTIEGNDKASRKVKEVNEELEQLDSKSERAARAVGNLGKAIAIGLVARGVQEFAGITSDLRDLGAEANQSAAVFQNLAGGTIEAEMALSNMRTQTGGIVDDLTLMQGANSLLLTNLAGTTDEAAELTQVAVRLGAAMGQDATTSIENFNAALLNNSFQRLDTLGISAATVRERVNELKDAGLDMSEAFAQATLEQGQEALLRLGDAATASETSFNRLTTQFQNFRVELGSVIADAGEAAAQLVILADIGLGGDGFGTVDRSLQYTTEDNFNQSLDPNSRTGIQPQGALNLFEDNPDLFDAVSGGAFTDFATGTQFNTGGAGTRGVTDDLISEAASEFGVNFDSLSAESQVEAARDLDLAIQSVRDSYLELNPIVADTTEQLSEQANITTEQALASTNDLKTQQLARIAANEKLRIRREEQEIAEAIAQQQADELAAAQAIAAEREAIISIEEQLFSVQQDQLDGVEAFFAANSNQVGDNIFFDPDDVASLISQAQELQSTADGIALLAEETDFEIITRDEVQSAQDLADQARDIANEAERAAAALERASLSELFGQTDGGRLGEITDAIAAGIEDEDQRNAFLDEAALASGRETEVSQNFDDSITPILTAIAEELGAQAAIDAAQRFDDATLQGTADGLSQQDLIALQQQALGFQIEGDGTPQASTTVQSGEGINSVASRLGVAPDDVRDVVGDSVLQPGQTITIGEGTRLVAITDEALTNEGVEDTGFAGDTALGLNDELTPKGEGEGLGITDGFSEDAANNSTIIADNVASMSESELDGTLDGFNLDLAEAETTATGALDRLETIGSLELEARVDLLLMLNNETGLTLAPIVAEQIELYFNDKGLPSNIPESGV